MEKKSSFFPPLQKRIISFPESGEWQRNTNIDKLSTIASMLDTSRSKDHPDKLHSVPTPWARLLLFESALYDSEHPAHDEVVSQWRGLLGLLGLAEYMRLQGRLKCQIFELLKQQEHDIQKAFVSLRPKYLVNRPNESRPVDVEEGKWDTFDIILLDDIVIGASSPRTIVFTSIRHQVPEGVPEAFHSRQGRLSDPAPYFKAHDDRLLSVLSQWLGRLIESVETNAGVEEFLGFMPSAPDAKAMSRRGKLIGALKEWKSSLGRSINPTSIILSAKAYLSKPFDFIKPVEYVPVKESDLFLRGRKDVIVCFRPEDSVLVEEGGNLVRNVSIRVYEMHQTRPGQPLPAHVTSLVDEGIRVIENPLELLEDSLIEASVTHNAALYLSADRKQFLIPLRKEVLDFLSDEEVREIVKTMELQSTANSIRLEMKIPLEKGRSIKLYKDYDRDREVILDSFTQNLIMWPDFICTKEDDKGKAPFEHYFYYTSEVTRGEQVEFTPLGDSCLTRDIPEKRRRWYLSKRPLLGFSGSIRGRQGMLLINYPRSINPPSKEWKVGLDFGSTHTNVFYGEPNNFTDDLNKIEINPLHIEPRVRIITGADQAEIQENFFFWRREATNGAADNAQESSITTATQIILPISEPERYDDWLPREGQAFLGSIINRTLANRHETDLKWNRGKNNFMTGVFLRSLMFMVEAEAIANNAKISEVFYAYPTAFPEDLTDLLKGEMMKVSKVVGIPVDGDPSSEAFAVCRHLYKKERGRPIINTIALDIGGSTTDIAVWASAELAIQESVKMAAGAISRYIELNQDFRSWFVSTLNDQLFDYSLPNNLNRLVFHAVLNDLEAKGLLNQFINTFKANRARPEVASFLAHMVLIFSAISYFTGMLTRRAGIEADKYYPFFCGKGGQFLRWIFEADSLVQKMFNAGFLGPDGDSESEQKEVSLRVSDYPKQEVGRGLLVQYDLKARGDSDETDMIREKKATVTVGEDGYPNLNWNDNLTFEKLKSLIESGFRPAPSSLRRLNHFIKVFSEFSLTQSLATEMGISKVFPSVDYRDALISAIHDNIRDGQHRALIEPLFITEVKVLIELVTGRTTGQSVDDLFDKT